MASVGATSFPATPEGTAKDIPFADPHVEAKFRSYAEDIRPSLLQLRALIFDTAGRTDGVGPLHETLKWGQPSYLTKASGSTIRIDQAKGEREDGQGGRLALFVHCQTDLIETFKQIYGNGLVAIGNRALLFSASEPLPVEALRHCIGLALTYHTRRHRRARTGAPFA